MRLVAAALALAVLAAGCGRAEKPYVKKNEQLLALAKPYPGARLERTESDPYNAPDDELGVPIGYTTLAYYVLPRRLRPSVVAAFYARELAGWKAAAVTLPCVRVRRPPGTPAAPPSRCRAPTTVSFRKGPALIELQGLDGGVHYIVAVDHDDAQNAH